MEIDTVNSDFHGGFGDANPITVNIPVMGEIPSFAQGFDRLLLLERALSSFINIAAGAADGLYSSSVFQLLGDHRRMIAAEIGLLSSSSEAAPPASPFGHSPQTPSFRAEIETSTDNGGNKGLAGISAQHRMLVGTLEEMTAGQPHNIERNVLLKDLAQRHEEMARVLSAALNEDKTARR